MITISRLLIICMMFSCTLTHADDSIPQQAVITKSKRGPSTANKVFGVLKEVANAYMLIGIGATIFCGYLWLVHEVNSPERMNEMTGQQEKILLALDQLKTPREHLKAVPQILKLEWFEFLKNIDVATAIGAMTAYCAGAAYLLFAGAHALTSHYPNRR